MDGLKALNEGRYKDALDLCTRAESLMHAPTHLLLIARAQTKLGRFVEAEETYIKITREHLAADASPAFFNAQKAATQEESDLSARTPKLTINLAGPSADQAQVTVNGASLAAAAIGLTRPVDPGTYALSATAPGVQADPLTVTLAAGETQSVTLALKPLAVAAPEPVAEPSVAEAPDESPDSAGHHRMRLEGVAALGVGAAGMIVGSLFVVKNHSDRGDANALCNAGSCPDAQRSAVESFDGDANTAATIAWVSYGVGVVGLATGAVLLWLSGKGPAHAQSARALPAGEVIPWVGARSAGVRVTF